MRSLHPSDDSDIILRPVQRGDLDAVESIFIEAFSEEYGSRSVDIGSQIRRLRTWYAPVKAFSLFPNRFQHMFTVHVAEQEGAVKGVIQVSPFNYSRSTWRVDHIAVAATAQRQGVGSRLLRHCMKHFREAHMWILEVNIHNRGAIGLYHHNGFQPIAQITYWSLSPEILSELATRPVTLPVSEQTDRPYLRTASNRDAFLIYQLDTASMPPLVRQVYDRHVNDFKSSVLDWMIDTAKQSISNTERIRAYVYEPERKAAIGYFNLKLSRTGQLPHVAQLLVHPAYTELYPELLAQMARLTQNCPTQSLALASTDYQPEREEFLMQLGANDLERTLLMSRSVWHKIRETRVSLDSLRLQSVLRGLQVNQPIPERIDVGSVDFSDSYSIDTMLTSHGLVNSLAEWQEEKIWPHTKWFQWDFKPKL